MRLLLVLSSVSIVFLVGAVYLGLMVLSGNIAPTIHMMVAFFGAMISIVSHVIFIGRYFRKD